MLPHKYHFDDVIISVMVPQTTGILIVYSTVCSGTDQRKHQSSVSLAFVRWIHQWLVNSPHKGPVTRIMFSFDDIIMAELLLEMYSALANCHNSIGPQYLILHTKLLDLLSSWITKQLWNGKMKSICYTHFCVSHPIYSQVRWRIPI